MTQLVNLINHLIHVCARWRLAAAVIHDMLKMLRWLSFGASSCSHKAWVQLQLAVA